MFEEKFFFVITLTKNGMRMQLTLNESYENLFHSRYGAQCGVCTSMHIVQCTLHTYINLYLHIFHREESAYDI